MNTIIWSQFPILHESKNIYFDSASTTLKPQVVIDEVNGYVTSYTANVGRGSYDWAQKTSNKIKDARKKTAKFINAHPDEIVFTSGATESLNTVAYSWGLHNLQDGDEVIVGKQDHKSNVLPWIELQKKLKRFGISIYIRELGITPYGQYNISQLKELLSPKTKVLVLTHVHNVFGVQMFENSLREIIGEDIVISLDVSQSISHVPIDAQVLGVDFISFSGHKMFGYPGTGVLWVHKRNMTKMSHLFVGGDGEIQNINTTAADFLEAGTPNITGILALSKAVEFITDVGIENIESYVRELTSYAKRKMNNIEEIVCIPQFEKSNAYSSSGIISFTINGFNSADVGNYLAEHGIFLRTGKHCSANDTIGDSIRLSMHVYNTKEEIDYLIKILKEMIYI